MDRLFDILAMGFVVAAISVAVGSPNTVPAIRALGETYVGALTAAGKAGK